MYLTSIEQRMRWIREKLSSWGFVPFEFNNGKVRHAAWATEEFVCFQTAGIPILAKAPVMIGGNPFTKMGSWIFAPMRFREDRDKKINQMANDVSYEESEERAKKLWKEHGKDFKEVFDWGTGKKKTFGMGG